MIRIYRKHGFTLIELIVYSAIVLIIFGFISQIFWGAGHVETGRKRLGLFQDLRLSSQKLNMSLTQATRILFPPPDGKAYNQIVYLSEQGELMIVYLNEENNLQILNYDGLKHRQEEPVSLARRAMEFSATRPPGTEDYVQYLLRIKDEKDVEFCVSEGIVARNIVQ